MAKPDLLCAPDGYPYGAFAPAAHPDTELLRTRRMILRRLVYRDASALARLDADERVTRWLLEDSIANPLHAFAFIAHVNGIYARGTGLGIWHARTLDDSFLGYFSLMPVDDTAEVEIGVRLMPEAWGRFHALEGGRALCEYAFERLALPRLVAFCDPGNRVVPVLLRRLGFTAAGDAWRFDRPALRFVRAIQ